MAEKYLKGPSTATRLTLDEKELIANRGADLWGKNKTKQEIIEILKEESGRPSLSNHALSDIINPEIARRVSGRYPDYWYELRRASAYTLASHNTKPQDVPVWAEALQHYMEGGLPIEEAAVKVSLKFVRCFTPTYAKKVLERARAVDGETPGAAMQNEEHPPKEKEQGTMPNMEPADPFVGPWIQDIAKLRYPGLAEIIDKYGADVVAKQLKIKARTINAWRSGASFPGKKQLNQICKTYDVTKDYLKGKKTPQESIDAETDEKENQMEIIKPATNMPGVPLSVKFPYQIFVNLTNEANQTSRGYEEVINDIVVEHYQGAAKKTRDADLRTKSDEVASAIEDFIAKYNALADAIHEEA